MTTFTPSPERMEEIGRQVQAFHDRWKLAKAYREAGIAIVGASFYENVPFSRTRPEERELFLLQAIKRLQEIRIERMRTSRQSNAVS